MTTPASFNLNVTVQDNITGESASKVSPFTVNIPQSGGGNPPPPPSSQCLFGWYDPANDGDMSQGWTGGDGGMGLAGPNVKICTYYTQWLGGFPVNLCNQSQAHGGVIPFIELEPWFTTSTWPPFANIAAGAYDSWLTGFGSSIATFGHDVWLTYAHEQNGNWYPWGNGGAQSVTPAQWLASWKHVHDTINSTANGHAKWVWAPNNADVGSVVPYYPGDNYCDVAAADMYIQNSSQTFGNFHQNTINQIRSVTSTKPIWNAETGLLPADGTQPGRITSFIKAMHGAGMAGFMFWNQPSFNVTGASLQAVVNAVAAWNAGTL